jgi:ubiquinone/menaquinone biosynthesis C-methylase UbiE
LHEKPIQKFKANQGGNVALTKMKKQHKAFADKWRKQLLSFAKGEVLEVNVGTGENFNYYPLTVKVTATDMSGRLIEVARKSANEAGVKTNFIVSRMEDLKLPSGYYDTVVSTFSMCAYENPATVLNQFSQWCKKEGNILLMEHGLSSNKLVSWIQRKWAPFHLKKTGCHFDRNIEKILGESNLRVLKIEKKLAGIVQLIWARTT